MCVFLLLLLLLKLLLFKPHMLSFSCSVFGLHYAFVFLFYSYITHWVDKCRQGEGPGLECLIVPSCCNYTVCPPKWA